MRTIKNAKETASEGKIRLFHIKTAPRESVGPFAV